MDLSGASVSLVGKGTAAGSRDIVHINILIESSFEGKEAQL
jgi:hypothetical protein